MMRNTWRNTWNVARRELGGFFDQPTAYVLAIAFLVLSLYLAFRTLLASGVATLRPLFDLLPILFAVFVPAVTMRSLAEERRGGTLEWLMAQPLQETQVVVGKFLGNWLFVLITLAGTLPAALGLLLLSDADPGIILAQYIGAALLAAQLVALGLWTSSLTRNQITAFILGSGLSFLLFLIGLPVVQIGLPPLLSGALARLSLVGHFENVARGVVDLRDVLYFLSTGALFLVLTGAVLARERLSHTRPDYRRLRLGALVTALLVLTLNLLGGHIRGRLDLTRENLYTLSEGTKELLQDLDDLVQVKLFASSELPPEVQLQLRDVRDLLADFRRFSGGNVVVRDLNPDEDDEAREEASSLGISPIEFNVVRDDEFQVKRGYYGLALTFADEQEVIPVVQQTADLEYRLASAIAGMTRTETPRIAFAQGYGASAAYELPAFRDDLVDRYEVTTLQLQGDSLAPIAPDSIRVLVVAGPTQPLDSGAVERVRDYLEGGGSALFLLEPVELNPQSPMPTPVRSGLEPLLEDGGIRFNASLVADLASNQRVSMGQRGIFNVISPYPLWPIAIPAGSHSVTRGLNSLSLGWAGALELTDTARVRPLWVTTDAATLKGPGSPIQPDQDWNVPEDQLAVRTVAAAVLPAGGGPRPATGVSGVSGEPEGPKETEQTEDPEGPEGPEETEEAEAAEDGTGQEPEPSGTDQDSTGSPLAGRMIVVGDATFLESQFAQASPQNVLFASNAVDWLAQDESLIRIRAKNRTPPALVLRSDLAQATFKWGNLVGVPALLALIGVIRVTGRRRRAEARWKEVVS